MSSRGAVPTPTPTFFAFSSSHTSEVPPPHLAGPHFSLICAPNPAPHTPQPAARVCVWRPHQPGTPRGRTCSKDSSHSHGVGRAARLPSLNPLEQARALQVSYQNTCHLDSPAHCILKASPKAEDGLKALGSRIAAGCQQSQYSLPGLSCVLSP